VSIEAFEKALTESERQKLARLATPGEVQAFLDSIPYSIDPFYRCASCASTSLTASMAPCLLPLCCAASGTRR
jgi:hypothetical protein